MKLCQKQYICILLILILGGCNPAIQPNETQFPENGSEVTIEPVLSATSEFVDSLEDAAPTTIEASTTPTPYLRVCIKLDEVDQIDAGGDVFAFRLESDDGLILKSSDNLRLATFMNTKIKTVVSPDRAKIAFIQESSQELVIASSDGSILRRYPIPHDWVVIISWVSDNRIFIGKDLDEDSRLALDELIIFDLAAGSYEELSPDFPDIVPWIEAVPHWFGNLIFLPDPTLSYVVYELSGGGISLWDMDSNLEIIRLNNNYYSRSAPVWSQDGGWFIASAPVTFEESGVRYTNVESELPYVKDGNDLFLVTTQGDIHRLTFFSTQYYAELRSWSLSPDETKLAFWVDTDFGGDDYNWQLAVLDIPTGDISIYCVTAGNVEFPVLPIWSPDAEGLMVTNRNEPETWKSLVFVIDLISNEIFTYPEYALGRGWLTQVETTETNEPQ